MSARYSSSLAIVCVERRQFLVLKSVGVKVEKQVLKTHLHTKKNILTGWCSSPPHDKYPNKRYDRCSNAKADCNCVVLFSYKRAVSMACEPINTGEIGKIVGSYS